MERSLGFLFIHLQVNVEINGIQPNQTSISGIHDRNQPTSQANRASDLPFAGKMKGVCIAGNRREAFDEGKGRINSKQEEVKEQEAHPMDSTLKLSCCGQGDKEAKQVGEEGDTQAHLSPDSSDLPRTTGQVPVGVKNIVR